MTEPAFHCTGAALLLEFTRSNGGDPASLAPMLRARYEQIERLIEAEALVGVAIDDVGKSAARLNVAMAKWNAARKAVEA